MPRYALQIEYHGGPFAGWQRQAQGLPSVQAAVERALGKLEPGPHTIAAAGRTVLLSSHLMSEMAITADRLIIIGRGRLIADTTVDDLLAGGASAFVKVRSPRAGDLATLLQAGGAIVSRDPDDSLRVTGLASNVIGEIATVNAIPLLELSEQRPTLEETYMQLTADAVDYRTNAPASESKG